VDDGCIQVGVGGGHIGPSRGLGDVTSSGLMPRVSPVKPALCVCPSRSWAHQSTWESLMSPPYRSVWAPQCVTVGCFIRKGSSPRALSNGLRHQVRGSPSPCAGRPFSICARHVDGGAPRLALDAYRGRKRTRRHRGLVDAEVLRNLGRRPTLIVGPADHRAVLRGQLCHCLADHSRSAPC
jgi:hypothetical protein